ncbi:TonB-dependent receptor plug domain-containing protein [Algoriphagus sp. CAU 1675]|uniref:TonB-dependent receptor plug domain-containing protein n=1 Tax=Algoriphagus sp. CAU 1675 TaxID=3032597 RepID=UPI0023DC1379|nr:TonB-dependent receptor plug domain-containing protein [Algoriphagus sp. CAU 1675]MDF2158751.1 TonB-dependent receptor plug domain-containing protein [Algoriphagus sp. CAU 1675]
MQKLSFYLLGLVFFFFSKGLFAQDLAQKIQSYFAKNQQEFPVEKVFLHLDKQTYTLGEDLWFSAYLVAGSEQIPSPLSQTLYVGLFDGDGLLLEQKSILVEKGRGKGDFILPAFGKPGTYRLKAFTSWMRNFGEEYFFTAEINVIDGAAGSFLPEIKFNQIRSENGRTVYQSELTAIDNQGKALSNQSLQVKVLGNQEELHQQEVLLNAQGLASFTFSIPEQAFKSQHLEITYLENGNYPVTQKIRLPYSLNLADIQFLPEGGRWLIGKKSTMAFRAVAPDGMPLEIQGHILEDESIQFSGNESGLGKFEITPSQSDYRAEIKAENQSRVISLPEASSDGLVLQVVNNPAASYITAFVQGSYNPNSLLLVSQTRGIVNYMIQGALNNGVWGVRIPKENLITGINQITVLDPKGKPLLERLVFINKGDELKLEMSQSGTLSPREKITLSFTNQFSGQAAPGSFSLAILDADQADGYDPNTSSIFSELLLNSDLRGNLHQAGRYFKDQEATTMEALDLVMLTHGWRRFNWTDIVQEKSPEISHFIERGINIEGQVTDQEDTKKGLGGGKITAMVGDGIEILTTEYGPNGRFIFRDLHYSDSAQITITAEDNRLKNFIDVEVIQPEAVLSSLTGSYPNQTSWPEGLASTYQERTLMQRMYSDQDKIMDLEGVTVEGQTIAQEEEEVRKIYGAGDVSINPEKIPGTVAYSNVFQLIQGRVSGVQIFVSGLDVSVQIRGPGSINAGTSPLFLLDNIPVDAGTLLQINPRDVASVDVFKDPARTAIFGAQGANGVIAVYTKTGSGVSVSVGGTLVTRYGGYAVAREFYQPKYDVKSPENSLTDKRATIYWNPILEIDESGQTQVEYYNTDVAKKQILIMEGMDAEGRLGRLVRILE